MSISPGADPFTTIEAMEKIIVDISLASQFATAHSTIAARYRFLSVVWASATDGATKKHATKDDAIQPLTLITSVAPSIDYDYRKHVLSTAAIADRKKG
ncbi:hypothetical protein FY145_17425 [Agrobacterium tumefaciens]|uniref:Uncharacterized protein n=1 Tax=Agrobacterium tumefaciens TaxID=358 RepID=A0AAP9J7J1_AGRTU|nr:hypothetical protein [Agrobacterium tumefaciens]NSZ59581.1 hypothetical protein [Agrobacterium tumefaciens]QDY96032.1 hypothetical protein CG010_017730 [Agrobacterium tumefaciens]UXS46275.1 hypothetical protein FY149_03130 [Agrobacterium tumefaciens]UXS73143.1 hypothetical protein FY146_21795 [Agrobacterium tumefaciens]UXS80022.1 hypothetical protein FY145_17425 [Agrobacterium tumefaciens]